MDLLYSIAQAGSGARAHYGLAGWAGWLGYKVPYAACRKIPCPSAAAQRAVGPQPTMIQSELGNLFFFVVNSFILSWCRRGVREQHTR